MCHAHRAELEGDLPHNEPPGPVRRGPRHPHLVDIPEHYDTHELLKVVPRLSSVPDIHVSQLDMAGSSARRHSLPAMRHRMAETSSRILLRGPLHPGLLEERLPEVSRPRLDCGRATADRAKFRNSLESFLHPHGTSLIQASNKS